MTSLVATLTMMAVSLWGVFSFAQQQPRYPVDPQTKWAIGAKPKPADELKKQLDSGSTVIIIDVRPPANFEKDVQGHFHRLYLRDGRPKLAGCEAS